MERIKSRYDEIYAHCATTAMWFIHQADPRKTMEVPAEEREAFWEKLYGEPGFGIWLGNFRDTGVDEKANAATGDHRPEDPPAREGPEGGGAVDLERSRLGTSLRAAGKRVFRGLQPPT